MKPALTMVTKAQPALVATCPQSTVLEDSEGRAQNVECVNTVGHEGQCCGYWCHIGEPTGHQWWGINEEPAVDAPEA